MSHEAKKDSAPVSAPALVAMRPPEGGAGPVFVGAQRFDIVGGVLRIPAAHVAVAKAAGFTVADAA